MTMPIRISTTQRGVAGGRIKEIDWTSRSDRKWLETHLHWAMCNYHDVHLSPVFDYTSTIESKKVVNRD